MSERCAQFAKLAPAAFAPTAPAVRATVSQLARNYASSTLPVGTSVRVEPADKLVVLSAGTDSHGDTTASVIEHAFVYLDCGARGATAAANAAARAKGKGVAVSDAEGESAVQIG